MRTGLDRLARHPDLVDRLRSRRVGLLAHPASVTLELSHASDVLASLGVVPKVLFGPEHGYGGEAQDMVGVPGAVDARTGSPIVSLYGERFDDLSPKPEHLAALDLLLVDLADVGSRYYTFVWTALLAVRAAARAGVPVVLLDRPNPLGVRAADVAGRVVEPGFASFVGLEPVAVRHGLTVGELVALFAARDGLSLGRDAALSIVPCEGASEAFDPAFPFVLTSPNMPTLATALVYPGGCLLEGTNLSEGRGTTKPFEIVGAPWLDGRALAEGLGALLLPGVRFRALTFQPTFHKHAQKVSGGVEVRVTDAAAFRPVATYVALVALAREQSPERFAFRTERYEYVDDIPAFDLLTGSAEARGRIERGEAAGSVASFVDQVAPSFEATRDEARAAAARASLG